MGPGTVAPGEMSYGYLLSCRGGTGERAQDVREGAYLA